MDIKIQETILDTYQQSHREAKGGHHDPNDRNVNVSNAGNFIIPTTTRHRSVTSSYNAQRLETQRANSRPADQLLPNSSLGAALGNIARMVDELGGSDDPYDASSDYDSSVYYRSTRSRDSSRSRRRRRRRSKRRSSRKNRRHSQKMTKSSIKPIPPKDYDGAADVRAYHRFVMEGEAYLRDGKVHRERQIRILAHYLDGKAYQFYMQKVASDDPKNWDLHKFFTELFNFCFPVDYRQQMRLKLENFYQKKGQTISEFVFELQELFSMVGAMPDDLKVVKLWYRLNARTQRAMWRDRLHPDVSTWEEIIAKAEVIEIADNVLDRRDNVRAPGQKNWRANNNFDDKRNIVTASRSMTYSNRDRENDRHPINAKNNNQSRQPSRSRHGSAQPFRKRQQSGNALPRASGSGTSSSAKKKSVKFADLTEKEMAQLRSEGRCFNCKEVGHMSRNCPSRSTVKGSGDNKPPGLPSYSMEMTLLDEDIDGDDVLETMPLGAINFGAPEMLDLSDPKESWREWYPTWKHPQALARERIGNCYEMASECTLTTSQPYPGDNLRRNPDCSPHNRFRITQMSGDSAKFKIMDRFNDFEIIVKKGRLANLHFNLGHWYAVK